MKNLKKFLAVVLSVAIMATSMATAFAADNASDPLAAKYPEAAMMRDLGILQGSTGVTEAYLKQVPVRIQAAVLTLRLTGNEAKARDYSGLAHFADVVANGYWATNIMGYLKANPGYGWLGDNNGKLNPEAKIQKQEFAKVLLKALGYDQGTHYEWSGVMAAYKAAGLVSLEDADNNITMNDIAIAINEALNAPVRGSTDTLAWRLSLVNPDFKAAAIKAGLIQAVSIKSVVSPNLGSAGEGSIVTPPAQVVATMTDGSTKNVDVKWSADRFDTSAAGDATLTGTIEGFDAGVTATLKVVAAAITNVNDVDFENVYVGDEVTLPETVDATFSNGKVEAVPVTWTPAEVDTSAVADLTFKGTVAGYDKEITATMSVVEKAIASVAAIDDITVNEGAELVLPETVEATYTNGDVVEVPVVWNAAVVDVNAPKAYAVEGTVEGYEAGVVVKVVVAPVVLDFTLSADNYREVTVAFNKPVNADNMVAANFAVTDKTIKGVTVIDSKTVRISITTSIAAQGKFEVTVKTDAGMAADTKKTSNAVIDAAIPTVVSVDAIGNSQIKVVFSEAVASGYNVLTNFKLNGLYFGQYAPELKDDLRTLILKPTVRMAAGVNKLSVSNVADGAGYVIPPVVDFEFAVAADSTAPTFVGVESATMTKVVFLMNEAVAKPDKATDIVSSPARTVDDVTVDGNKIIVTYTAANALPVSGASFTLKNITDVFGNKAADIAVPVVVPTLDIVKPVFLGAVAEGSSNNAIKLVVAFDKEVQVGAGSFTLKNADGATVFTATNASVVRYNDGKDDIKTKVYVQGSIATGTYKLSISDVKDNTGLQNVMLPVVDYSIVVPDKTPPTATLLKDQANNKIYIVFNEAVTADSAQNKANYMYMAPVPGVPGAEVIKALNADTTVTLLADGKTVEIAFPKTGDNKVDLAAGAVTSIQIANIVDAGNNAVATTLLAYAGLGGPVGTPTVTGAAANAKITGKNTIVLTYDQPLLGSSVAVTDFTLGTSKGAVLNVINATYADNAITLTTAEDIAADTKVDSVAINVYVKSSAATTNVYGTSIAAQTIALNDFFAPSLSVASAVYDISDGNTVVTLKATEALIGATAGAGSTTPYTVVVEGVVKAYTATFNAADNTVVLTFVGQNFTDKTVSVKYFNNGTIKDSATNAMATFELVTDAVTTQP